jgi:hypothetical protein
MNAAKRHRYSKLYYIKSKLIFIPSSTNTKGVDPLPQYFVELGTLSEVLDYTRNPSSTNIGYRMDKKSGFYVKNIEMIDEEEVGAQLNWMKSNPPYWFFNSQSYEAFVDVTMNTSYQNELRSKFMQKISTAKFQKAVDDLPDHYYVEIEEKVTWSFLNDELITWPKIKNIGLVDVSSIQTAVDILESSDDSSSGSNSESGSGY